MECHSPSIVCLTETWLNDTVIDSEISPAGYALLRKDRRAGRGGGVAVLIKSNLEFSLLPDLPGTETIWCKIYIKGIVIVIGVLYRPPNSDDIVPAINDYLVSNKLYDCRLLLAGDFNLPHVNWNLLIPTGRDRTLCASLIDLAVSFGLTQVVDTETRKDAILDLVFVNQQLLSHGVKCEVIDGLSDHKAVEVALNLVCPPQRPEIKTVLNFSNADDTSVLDTLASSYDEFVYCSEFCNVDTLLLKFCDIVRECQSKYVPQKYIKRNPRHPWYNREIIQLTRRVKRLRKNRHSRCNDNVSSFNTLKSKLGTKMKEAKNYYFSNTLARFMKKNPSRFWRSISPPSSIPSSFIVNDQSCSNPEAIANAFNNYFKSVFSTDNGIKPSFSACSNLSALPDLEVSSSGVHNLILNLDVTKSSGPDGIHNVFLKRYSEWCANYLTVIFKKSIISATVPQLWKLANVVPVFKSGNKQLIPNYRPISLLSTSSKLLEHIIHKYIVEYLNAHNILSRSQHGFRACYSTVTQLLEFTHDVASSLNDRGQIDAIFIDYSKAFDLVCHAKLLVKLRTFFGDNKLVDWIADYLRSRTQFVTFNHVKSSEVQITSGVPQGSVLGPLLFIIYINDVAEIIGDTQIKLRMYADDCVIYNTISSVEDQEALNSVFSLFCNWSENWQMSINFKKTVAMTFSNKKQPLSFAYTNNGVSLARVTEFKYLGVTLTTNLKWRTHVETICNKALRKLWYLRRTLNNSTKECKLTAYKTLVRPILEYASVVWSPHHKHDIAMLESVQKKAIRFIFRRYDQRFSPTSHAHVLSLQSLEHRRTCDRIILLHKTVHTGLGVLAPISFVAASARRTRRFDPLNITPFRASLDCFKFSFFPWTVDLWNELDGSLRRLDALQFEKELRSHVFC